MSFSLSCSGNVGGSTYNGALRFAYDALEKLDGILTRLHRVPRPREVHNRFTDELPNKNSKRDLRL